MNENDFVKRLGKRITKLREAKGVDKKQFAYEIGISRSHLSEIEHGKVVAGIKTLFKIAQGLEVSMSELMDV